jgi:hypothetical protein
MLSLTGFSLVGGPAYSDDAVRCRDTRDSSTFPTLRRT